MTSWRASASQTAQDDLDGLLNVVLPAAENLLGRRAEFYPFGATVLTDGQASLAEAAPGLGDHPASDDVLSALYQGARANSPSLRAAAFVADVRANGSDAVRVELEHREGAALDVLLPYTRSRFKKTVTFGQMSVSRGEPKVWAGSQ